MRDRSYAHGVSTTALLGETISENLRRTAARSPGAEALVVRSQGVRLTYAQLVAECERAAKGLIARGVKKGDRVGIWAPNRHEWVILQYASAMAGAILTNINPAYKTSELAYALEQSGVSFFLLARAFRQSDFAGMLAEVRSGLPALRSLVAAHNSTL